jgi:hypothetical protein
VDSEKTKEGGLYLYVLGRSSQFKIQREEVKSEKKIPDSSSASEEYL